MALQPDESRAALFMTVINSPLYPLLESVLDRVQDAFHDTEVQPHAVSLDSALFSAPWFHWQFFNEVKILNAEFLASRPSVQCPAVLQFIANAGLEKDAQDEYMSDDQRNLEQDSECIRGSSDQQAGAHKKVRKKRGPGVLPKKGQELMKAWLQENQMNPYPSDSVKKYFTEAGGLSRKQVDTWFKNARLRMRRVYRETEYIHLY